MSEKPLSCERCSLTFTSKSQFAIHIRTHSAGQNFHCSLCGRTFIRDSYLIRHHNRVHRERTQGSSSIQSTINAVVAGSSDVTVFEGTSQVDISRYVVANLATTNVSRRIIKMPQPIGDSKEGLITSIIDPGI